MYCEGTEKAPKHGDHGSGLFASCEEARCNTGLGQLPLNVVYVVSVLFLPFSVFTFSDTGFGQLPLAAAVPALSLMEPADRTAGAAAENASAPASTAAAAIFLNM
jgi:hypothetical protein